MGISGFHQWMKKRYPDAYEPLGDTPVDHLYVDLSSVLHTVVRTSRDEDDFIRKLFARLTYLMEVLQPRRSVVLAMDGPAPLAKLLTQRDRRQKDSRRRASSSLRKPQWEKAVSKQALTPGTPFMGTVEDALEFFVCQKLCSRRWSGLDFELLTSTVEGEGELKIMQRIAAERDSAGPGDTHMILGGDSDLVVMALLAEEPKLYVINDNQNALRMFQNLRGSELEGKGHRICEALEVFSVEAQLASWARDRQSAKFAQTAEDIQQLKLDFAAISIMSSGNDYLPAVRNIWGNSLWDEYLDHRANRKARAGGALVTTSPAATVAETGQGEWDPWTHPLGVDLGVLQALLAGAAAPQFSASGNGKPNQYLKDPRERASMYLKGVAWNLNMYQTALCYDYRFVYHGDAPEALDFEELRADVQTATAGPGVSALLGPLNEILNSRSLSGALPSQPLATAGRPLLPHTFALALMPRSASTYAPHALRHLMLEGSPVADLFRDCKTCNQMSRATSDVHKVYHNVRESIKKIEEANGSELDHEAVRKMEVLLAKQDDLKSVLRSLDLRRAKHVEEAHPYRPFPIYRLEQAVQCVPASSFRQGDIRMTKFGASYCYQRQNSSEAGQDSFPLPVPPVKAWHPLRIGKGSAVTRKVVERGGVGHGRRPEACWSQLMCSGTVSRGPKRKPLGDSRRAHAVFSRGTLLHRSQLTHSLGKRTGSLSSPWARRCHQGLGQLPPTRRCSMAR